MFRRLPLLLALAATAFAAGAWLAASPYAPLGVPSEWVWPRVAADERAAWSEVGLSLLGLALTLGLVVAAAGAGQHDGRAARRAGLLIVLLLLVVLLLVGGLQLTIDAVLRGGTARWIGVLHSTPINGVFTLVSEDAAASDEVWTDFEGVVRGRGTHLTNNPPGLIVVYRAVWGLFERRPRIAGAVAASQPESVRQELARLESNHPRSASPGAGPALWTVAVLSRALAIAVVLPVVWLAMERMQTRSTKNNLRRLSPPQLASPRGRGNSGTRFSSGPRGLHHAEHDAYSTRDGYGVALLAGALAGLMPAATLFAPRQDTVYPTFAAIIVAFACRAFARRSLLAAAAAGLLLFTGMCFSLAFAVVGMMAGILWALECWQLSEAARASRPAGSLASSGRNDNGGRPGLRVLAGALRLPLATLVAWFVGPCLLYARWRCDMFAIWRYNVAEHSDFYLRNGRTYETWLWVNPIEFAVALGVPVALFAAWHVAGQLRRFLAGQSFDALALSWAGTLVALNVSGLNMGEVARLWLPFMPFGGVLAAQTVAEFGPRLQGWCAGTLVLLQAISCVLLARYVRVLC